MSKSASPLLFNPLDNADGAAPSSHKPSSCKQDRSNRTVIHRDLFLPGSTALAAREHIIFLSRSAPLAGDVE
ncbi:hypothetical protein KC341_g23 [Hortaea werneckii]|nr:hypothetical protein KC341_g23 [Hortaea werneckii]